MSSWRVVVASENPVKIAAVKRGFTKMFPRRKFLFFQVKVPSGVPDQPWGEKETWQGALNRAQEAKKVKPMADYWVGIEGGVEKKDGSLLSLAWVVILGKEKIGQARTAAFFLPPAVASLVNKGKELGEADDLVFQKENSKQKMGAIGLLTDGVINRADYYYQAVVMALIPFKKKEFY